MPRFASVPRIRSIPRRVNYNFSASGCRPLPFPIGPPVELLHGMPVARCRSLPERGDDSARLLRRSSRHFDQRTVVEARLISVTNSQDPGAVGYSTTAGSRKWSVGDFDFRNVKIDILKVIGQGGPGCDRLGDGLPRLAVLPAFRTLVPRDLPVGLDRSGKLTKVTGGFIVGLYRCLQSSCGL